MSYYMNMVKKTTSSSEIRTKFFKVRVNETYLGKIRTVASFMGVGMSKAILSLVDDKFNSIKERE